LLTAKIEKEMQILKDKEKQLEDVKEGEEEKDETK
jgi:hypothetical protein